MAGYLTPESSKFLLDALVGKALPFTAPRTTYVGLATSVPENANKTLASITEVTTPGYARVAVAWDAAAIDDPTSTPAYVDNTSDTDFPAVTADMNPAAYAFLTDVATGNSLLPPVLTKGATASTGGTFASGTYYWVITAINARGETSASNEITGVVAANGTQVLTWAAISGATGYKVYRGSTSGAESVLVATLGSVTTYTDTGVAGTASAYPAENSASVGALLYVWELAEPITALAGKPVRIPKGGLIIE